MSKINEPISALIPIKNGSKYLAQFKSMMISSLRIYDEVIAVNDGSTDNTSEFLNDWASSASNVRVLHTKGIGLVESLNLGLAHSSHKWIARFDIDDNYEENRIELQRDLIAPDIVAVFSDYDFIDEKDMNYGLLTSPILPSATAISLVNGVRTPHPGVLLHKEAVMNVGAYRERDFPAEDLSLWLRLAKVGKIISIPNCLLHYRIRKGSISSSRRAFAIQKRDEVLKEFFTHEKDFAFCLEHIKKIFDVYEKYDRPEQRKILLIRDLLSANQFLGNNKRQKMKIISYGVSLIGNHRCIKELVALNRDKNRRNELRQSLV